MNLVSYFIDDHHPGIHHGLEVSTSSSSLQSTLASSNRFTPNLQITNVIGNVPLGLQGYSPAVRSDRHLSQCRPNFRYVPYGTTLPRGGLLHHSSISTPSVIYHTYPNAVPSERPHVFNQQYSRLPVHQSQHVYQPNAIPYSAELCTYPNTHELTQSSTAEQWNPLAFPTTIASLPQHPDLPLPQLNPLNPQTKDSVQVKCLFG